MKRILIADDDPHNRDILRRRLEKRGYEVVLAEDGQRALALVEQGTFDTVLLDGLMPAMSGLDVLRHMRARNDTTRVVMVTGKAMSHDVERARTLGADEYVIKPIDFARLIAAIEG